MNLLLSIFHLNGHALGFHPQTGTTLQGLLTKQYFIKVRLNSCLSFDLKATAKDLLLQMMVLCGLYETCLLCCFSKRPILSETPFTYGSTTKPFVVGLAGYVPSALSHSLMKREGSCSLEAPLLLVSFPRVSIYSWREYFSHEGVTC